MTRELSWKSRSRGQVTSGPLWKGLAHGSGSHTATETSAIGAGVLTAELCWQHGWLSSISLFAMPSTTFSTYSLFLVPHSFSLLLLTVVPLVSTLPCDLLAEPSPLWYHDFWVSNINFKFCPAHFPAESIQTTGCWQVYWMVTLGSVTHSWANQQSWWKEPCPETRSSYNRAWSGQAH